jgi:hypothetical protein
MVKPIGLLFVLLALAGNAFAQIDCSSGFGSSGACGVGIIGAGPKAFFVQGSQSGSNPALVGSRVNLVPQAANHAALSLLYQTKVNDQAFNTTFTFVPNGQNVVFMLENSNNNPTFNGPQFSSGAGCEADFYQAYGQANPPNNVFAVDFDSYNPDYSFTYSNVQVYQSNPYVQSPCVPPINGEKTYPKISTYPVPLNSPVGTQNTSTGDTYSANLVYNGTSLILNLFDVTAGGSCPGSSCFTHTFTTDAAGNPLNIPASVNANTAWMAFGGATGSLAGGSKYPLYISSVVYAEGLGPTPVPTPTMTSTPTATATATVTPTVTSTPTAGMTPLGVLVPCTLLNGKLTCPTQ